jgi:hypothetical protein
VFSEPTNYIIAIIDCQELHCSHILSYIVIISRILVREHVAFSDLIRNIVHNSNQ